MSKQPDFTPCIEYDCNYYATNHGRCSRHQKPWSGVTRRYNLPKDWKQRRKLVLIKDRRTCYACGGVATEVDHLINGDDHSMNNLASICRQCHQVKSSWEGHKEKGHNAMEPVWLDAKLRERGLR